MKTYRIKMYVYNRSRKNGKAFGVKFYQGYWLEIYRSYANIDEATAWVQDIHNCGLLWVDTWDITEK